MSRTQEVALAAAVTALVSTLLVVLAPAGVDLPAHQYLLGLYRHQGLVIWDNYWYDGRYPFVSYSLLYYPLAAAVGIGPLAVGSLVVFSGCFGALAHARFGSGASWAARTNAFCWGLLPLSAAYPFVLGAAFGAAAVAVVGLCAAGNSLKVSWPASGIAGVLAACCLGSSGLAYIFVWLVLLAVASSGLVAARRLARPLVAMALPGLAELVLLRLFPDYGWYPFWWADLVCIAVFAIGLALLALLGSNADLRRPAFFACGLLMALSVVAFVVRSDLGANVARVRDVALAIAILLAIPCAMRGGWLRRATAGLAVVAAAWWNLAPFVSAWAQGSSERQLGLASTWEPVVSFLHDHLSASYRVEAVDTAGHWPAERLASEGIPLVRGWFRQDDFPDNELLYSSTPLSAASYLAWLRSQAVKYVVVTEARPDFSSAAEQALVLSGHSGLKEVMSTRGGQISVFAVPAPLGLVVGPAKSSSVNARSDRLVEGTETGGSDQSGARVTRLGTSSLVLSVPRAGSYRLSVHWSRYWLASKGCVEPGPGGMTELVTATGGRVELRVDPTSARLWEALVGSSPPCCP